MVKPVELQDNLSKTQLLEKVHQLQKSTPEEAQKQFNQELQKKISEGKERVTDTPKSDQIIIHRDDKKKNPEERKKKDDRTEKNGRQTAAEENGNAKESNKKIDYIA
jgi:hypothetical protein